MGSQNNSKIENTCIKILQDKKNLQKLQHLNHAEMRRVTPAVEPWQSSIAPSLTAHSTSGVF